MIKGKYSLLKAMLIVSALGATGTGSGPELVLANGDYATEMPSMEECLSARKVIAEQDKTLKTLCVPVADETEKMQKFFNIFMDMLDQIKYDIEGSAEEKDRCAAQCIEDERLNRLN